jgi:hypothetical protein
MGSKPAARMEPRRPIPYFLGSKSATLTMLAGFVTPAKCGSWHGCAKLSRHQHGRLGPRGFSDRVVHRPSDVGLHRRSQSTLCVACPAATQGTQAPALGTPPPLESFSKCTSAELALLGIQP